MVKLTKKGQSMFEVIVAIAVTATTLVAIISLVGKTINNNTFSRDRTIAARHTIDALEWLRGRRDQDWGDFSGYGTPSGSRFCINTLPNYPAPLSSGSCTSNMAGTKYRREMLLTHDDSTAPSEVHVEISTSWRDSSGYHESRISTILTDWRTY